MGIDLKVEVQDIASAMSYEPETVLELLSEFAQEDTRFLEKTGEFASEIAGHKDGTFAHEQVPDFLRRIADAMEGC